MIAWALAVMIVGIGCLVLDKVINKKGDDMVGGVKVRTVTYGRKVGIDPWGNAEYILTAEVGPDQTVEDVMASLRKIVKCQLDEVKNDEEEEGAK